MTAIGSAERPLRVAIVGAGPSGFYAAAALLKAGGPSAVVDVIDRLPTPYGLVRGGVAPDHQNIKAVTKAYEKTAADERFRFFGNVRVGKDVAVDELYGLYDAVIWAIGAEADRRLGIPGEDLVGSHSATEFVGWYNGHPDFLDRTFDLRDVTSVVVVGVGNVAMDVTRVLVKDPDALATTDITDEAVAALRQSGVREVWVTGRRGAAQAKFSPGEIKEIGELSGVDLVVRPEDGVADPVSAEWMAAMDGRERANVQKNLDYLASRVALGEGDAPRKVRVAMCASPVEILGEAGRVRAVRFERTRLVPGKDGGEPTATGTGEFFEIPAQCVFRAVGYKGIELPGVPYDARKGIVPNEEGRVVREGAVVPGAYVVGWAKRGPTGLIGTNRADSIATVESLLADLVGKDGHPLGDAEPFLRARQPDLVTFADWKRLDALETSAGAARGKVRHKFARPAEALAALRA